MASASETGRIPRWKKVMLSIVAASGVVAGGTALLVRARLHRTFDAPEPPLRATADATAIERGRYLAFGPAHCAACHHPAGQSEDGTVQGTPPLSGGFSYPTPLGTLHFPNITPDTATGIGRYTDGQPARLLRYGVKPNGEAQLPIMEYQNISDEDIVAILSFLRAQEPVHNAVPPHDLSLVGMVVKAFVIRPAGPGSAPPEASPPEAPTIDRGEYLANRVAQCAACHPRRSMVDFSLTAPRLSGGMELKEPFAPDVIFVPPNLTPDPKTGHLVTWTEEQFVQRFHEGRRIANSPMPWDMFGHMSDADVRAIFRYLRSLPPVRNETGPTVRPRD